jgi:integrase
MILEARMVWAKPKFIWEDVDRHGNVRVYFCRQGQRKIRIHVLPDSPEFWAAYAAAAQGRPLPVPGTELRRMRATEGTLRWLCLAYCATPEYRRLDPNTQTVRRRVIESCLLEPLEPGSSLIMADCPLDRISGKHIKMLRDRKAEVPEAANTRLKALRGLFKWALVDPDLASRFPAGTNPARDVPCFRTYSLGFHTWTLEEVTKFEAAHLPGSTARLALALLLFTGQRKSDVIAFGRQHVKDGWLHFTQFKNRNRRPVTLDLPVLPELQAAIDAGPCGNLTFLVTAHGKPFTTAGFGNRMRKWCDAAGLKGCSAHGLRKAGACIAAENGATEAQLMAIFGWSDPDMAALYTKKARQKRIAGDAMRLLVRKEREEQ